MFNIHKYVRSGHANLKERLHVKSFKYQDHMHKFLNTGNNACSWHESKRLPEIANLKSGIYLFAGGQWLNVKKCDSLTLAHC